MPEILPPEPAGEHTAAWHEARRRGVGASEIYTIATGAGYGSVGEIWASKVDGWSPRQTLAMSRGSRLEPVVAAEFAALNPHLTITDTGTWVHPDHPTHLANPDRLVDSDSGLEIKTTNSHRFKTILSDGPEPSWEAQCQWCMHVTGRDTWWLAVWTQDSDLYVRRFDRDPDAIAYLADAADRFWQCVVDRVPPPESAAADAWPTADTGTTVVGDEQVVAAARRLRRVKTVIREHGAGLAEARREADELTELIQQAMRDADRMVDANGDVVCTWQERVRRGYDAARLDSLAEQYPDIAQCRTDTPYRTFSLKIREDN